MDWKAGEEKEGTETNGKAEEEGPDGEVGEVEVNGKVGEGERDGKVEEEEMNGMVEEEEMNGKVGEEEEMSGMVEEVIGKVEEQEVNGKAEVDQMIGIPQEDGTGEKWKMKPGVGGVEEVEAVETGTTAGTHTATAAAPHVVVGVSMMTGRLTTAGADMTDLKVGIVV